MASEAPDMHAGTPPAPGPAQAAQKAPEQPKDAAKPQAQVAPASAQAVSAQPKDAAQVQKSAAAPPKEPAPVAPKEPAAAKPKEAPKFKLPAAVYSTQMLESVAFEIRQYLDWYREMTVHKKVGAGDVPEPVHSAETVMVIETWLDGKTPTVESLEQLVEHLEQLKLPEVHIMLAAMPNRAQRQGLVDWFRNNSSDQTLVAFSADRNLGGGLVVRTPDHIFDFTWKQQLIAGRDKLAGIIKNV